MRLLILFVSGIILALTVAAEPSVTTNAPSGEYSLVQSEPKPGERPWNCAEEGSPCFQTTVRFRDRSKPSVHLAGVGWGYEDRADYAISPDSRWIARHQHTAGGWGVLVVYRVDTTGQVWRLDGDLISFALDQILAAIKGTKKEYAELSADDYTHISVDPTMRWTADSALLHFQIFATPREVAEGKPPSHPRVDRWVDYDPKKHKIILK